MDLNIHIASRLIGADEFPVPDFRIDENKVAVSFDYPLTRSTVITYESDSGFSLEDLIDKVCKSYQEIYDEDARTTKNPDAFDNGGTYGIWGHGLDELWIEGVSSPKDGVIDFSIGSRPSLAPSEALAMRREQHAGRANCVTHGPQQQTFVCRHIVDGPRAGERVGFFSDPPSAENQRPHAWCDQCEKRFQNAGGMSVGSPEEDIVRLICGACYDQMRQFHLGSPPEVDPVATIKGAREWINEWGCEFRVVDEGKDHRGFETLTLEFFPGPHSAEITFKEPSPAFPAGSIYCTRGCRWPSFVGDLTRDTWENLLADIVVHDTLCSAAH